MGESSEDLSLQSVAGDSIDQCSNGDLGDLTDQKKNRIQVSSIKKPLFFYVNLAKRYLQQHEEVELSALGTAITTLVTVAEILKNNRLAVEKKISTSTMAVKDETRERMIQKAKINIVLVKSSQFDELMAAENGDESDISEEVD